MQQSVSFHSQERSNCQRLAAFTGRTTAVGRDHKLLQTLWNDYNEVQMIQLKNKAKNNFSIFALPLASLRKSLNCVKITFECVSIVSRPELFSAFVVSSLSFFILSFFWAVNKTNQNTGHIRCIRKSANKTSVENSRKEKTQALHTTYQISFWRCLVDDKLVKWFPFCWFLLYLVCAHAAFSPSVHRRGKSASRQCSASYKHYPALSSYHHHFFLQCITSFLLPTFLHVLVLLGSDASSSGHNKLPLFR